MNVPSEHVCIIVCLSEKILVCNTNCVNNIRAEAILLYLYNSTTIALHGLYSSHLRHACNSYTGLPARK